MLDNDQNSDIFIFDDKSGLAVLRKDLNTVIIYTSSIEQKMPTLYSLLNSANVSKARVIEEVNVQGLFKVDYTY